MTLMAFKTRLAFTALLASTALVPGMAQAQTAREIELEARLKALEAAVQDLRGELNAARATASAATQPSAGSPSGQPSPMTAPTAVASSPTAPHPTAPVGPTAPTALAEAKAPAAAPSDGFKVAGTTVKLNGFIKTWASVSRYSGGNIAPESVGRDFLFPEHDSRSAAATKAIASRRMPSRRGSCWATETPIAGHTPEGPARSRFPGRAGDSRQPACRQRLQPRSASGILHVRQLAVRAGMDQLPVYRARCPRRPTSSARRKAPCSSARRRSAIRAS